jgi:hypothetical protein
MSGSRERTTEAVLCKIVALVAFLTTLCLPAFPITPDPAFASGGKFTTAFASTGSPNSTARSVFIQPSGRIVIVGTHRQQSANGQTALPARS